MHSFIQPEKAYPNGDKDWNRAISLHLNDFEAVLADWERPESNPGSTMDFSFRKIYVPNTVKDPWEKNFQTIKPILLKILWDKSENISY